MVWWLSTEWFICLLPKISYWRIEMERFPKLLDWHRNLWSDESLYRSDFWRIKRSDYSDAGERPLQYWSNHISKRHDYFLDKRWYTYVAGSSGLSNLWCSSQESLYSQSGDYTGIYTGCKSRRLGWGNGISFIHNERDSILKYSDENSLACTVLMAYYSAKVYYANPMMELPTGKGFADVVYLPKRDIEKRRCWLSWSGRSLQKVQFGRSEKSNMIPGFKVTQRRFSWWESIMIRKRDIRVWLRNMSAYKSFKNAASFLGSGILWGWQSIIFCWFSAKYVFKTAKYVFCLSKYIVLWYCKSEIQV